MLRNRILSKMALKQKIRFKTVQNGDRYDVVTKEVRLTPLEAIKRHCLECVAWNRKEVELCPSGLCALWGFRFGKDSSVKRPDVSDKRKGLPFGSSGTP